MNVKQQLIKLMLEQPFERIVEIAAQEQVTIHYDPRRGDYLCKYPTAKGFCETASQKTVKLALTYALVRCLTEQTDV